MKILLTGGTGLIGTALIQKISNNDITVLTRDTDKARKLLPKTISLVSDLSSIDFSELDAVINLAGEPIADKRWSKSQKEKICQSRWQITKQIADQINAASSPPTVFISGSAIGFYGRQSKERIIESDSTFNDEFTHQVCKTWEDLALAAESKHTRVCLLRTGIVLDSKKGALKKMLPAFKAGLGGPISNGQQIMSWIHIDDMVDIIVEALSNKSLSGAINACAPNAVSNEQFSQQLSQVLSRPCLFRVPKPILKLLLGEMADLLLYGQNIYPDKLLTNGFKFNFETLDNALINLLNKT